MVVLTRYISAGNRPADSPLLGGGRSAVISDELEQNRSMGADGPPLKAETGAETW